MSKTAIELSFGAALPALERGREGAAGCSLAAAWHRCLCGGAGSREPSEPAVGMAATAVRRPQQAPTFAAVQVAAEPTLAGCPLPARLKWNLRTGRGCG
jgi:hypothetical protein